MRTLTVNEMEGVNGGIAPVVAAVARCAASSTCRNVVKVGALAVAGAAAAAVGYENNREQRKGG